MASWAQAEWRSQETAPTARDRQGGAYRTYVPDRLLSRPLLLDDDLSVLAGEVEHEVRQLAELPGSRGLEGLARFLLRSEAIASSRIEGLQVSPQQVGLAELFSEEGWEVRGPSATARQVAANISAVRQATMQFARQAMFDVIGIEALQRILVEDQPRLIGLRQVQNWIGGSDYQPFNAEFVPPAPSLVEPLMDDLVAYMNGGAHSALVQSGLVHAQFETIHPFKDGNGRVGRALIHAVLVRRGLTRTAVLPVSLVLLTRSSEYVEALTAYRYDASSDSESARHGVSSWLRSYLLAVRTAVVQAQAFHDSLPYCARSGTCRWRLLDRHEASE